MPIISENGVDREMTLAEIAAATPTFNDQKAAKRDSAETNYERVMGAGAPYTFGSAHETLQCMSSQDQLNWTILQTQIERAIGAGAPTSMTLTAAGLLPLRCTSNNQYDVSLADALTVIMAIFTFGAAATTRLWDLKNRIDGLNGYAAPADAAALAAIDETSEWPS